MRNKSKLNGSDFAIKEDFSDKVRLTRKALYPYLKSAIDSGKRATIVYDHLLIDGKKYVFNENCDAICEVSASIPVIAQNNDDVEEGDRVIGE